MTYKVKDRLVKILRQADKLVRDGESVYYSCRNDGGVFFYYDYEDTPSLEVLFHVEPDSTFELIGNELFFEDNEVVSLLKLVPLKPRTDNIT